MNGCLRQHGVVLDLRLAERGAIPSDEYNLGYIRDIEKGGYVSIGTFSASGSSPKRSAMELDKRLPLRICLGRFIAEGVLA
jgi:hypothetical protein